ncbi:hypothetical protein CC78DRAFT_461048 [Lojkania enalia]|uniref:EthD domain-containing protein n=1 Tax=Lojkania enalia TaxID=147567 RepID=A0A9P4N707_9PLEO|nr:hypothetical protein CC78DRAFT_461048 [Didymosphaeria enalia]
MVHNKIDHKFTYPQLAWDQKENYQRKFFYSLLPISCIKLSFFFKKLPNVDDDHFQMHYNHVHSDLTVASKNFNVCKIQRYVQNYQTPEMKEKVKSLGMELLDYDACSSIWVRSWEDWEKFSTSDEYAKGRVSIGTMIFDGMLMVS